MHPRGQEILDTALGLAEQGVLFRHQGRDPKTGLDCAGLLVYIAKLLGLADFDTADYPKRPDVLTFRRHMVDAGCTPLSPADIDQGDILRVVMPQWPVHVGIYGSTGPGRPVFVHAHQPSGRVVVWPAGPAVVRRMTREAMRFPGAA